MAALIFAALLFVHGDVSTPGDLILYVVSHTTETRLEPARGARPIGKLKTFDIVSGREATPGWLEIDVSTAAANVRGQWIQIERENVVPDTLERVKYRLAKAEQARWPEQVRLDVARGRIRRGFTAEQVRLALGDPKDKQLRHENRDVAEEWVYDELRVVVSMKGVIEIRPSAATR